VSRDKNGQFIKGNPGGPGRPSRPTEAAYLNVLMGACTLEEFTEICGQAVSDAKDGDPKAREWLGRHLMGAVKTEAPTLLAVQQLLLTDIDPVYLERARALIKGKHFTALDFNENQVEKEEQLARTLMNKQVE
jgi:hypothetical protein